jgi:hypothetical protein
VQKGYKEYNWDSQVISVWEAVKKRDIRKKTVDNQAVKRRLGGWYEIAASKL